MDDMLKDARFAHIAKDPKFRRIPRGERKVKIDKRFQSMFKDKKFAIKYTVDKRGRPVNQTSSENLQKYYELSSSEDEDAEEAPTSIKAEQRVKKDKKKKIAKRTKQSKNAKNQDDQSCSSEQDEGIENEDDDSSDNCISSNGALLRIKPEGEEESESDTEKQSKSDADTDAEESVDAKNATHDTEENETQLRVKRKDESSKLPDKVKEKLRDLSVNYARGEGVLLSDSSSDEESSEASDEEEEIEHNWGELDKEADTTDEITRRLALCNMDWDRIRAVDLMVLFNSFLPSGGIICSVTIYPSEFGLKRMKEEEVSGPIELTQAEKEEEKNKGGEDDEEGSQYHMEKLRQYQLNRLKYYYAVIEFDSPETANKIYTECDGIEYESTATKLDLRFIPDDMEFDQTPKDSCTEIPELSKYQPRQFTTTALQQVKVELTWDETNPERQEIAQKINSGKLDEISENDLQAYLASDTSDEESEKEENKTKEVKQDDSESDTNADPIEKYKSLLKEIEEQEEAKQKKEVELEFTWGLGTKEKSEKLVQERLKKKENLTPFEEYLEKRKEKRKAKREERKKLKNADKDASSNSDDSAPSDMDADEIGGKKSRSKKKGAKKSGEDSLPSSDDENEERRKAELELLLMDENDEGNKKHFNMKKIEEQATMSKSKQKRLSKKKNGQDALKEDDFEVNVKDPRFAALFTSHHYNIDPADPHFRKTKGTDALISEKLKRRADEDIVQEVQAKQPKTNQKLNVELQALVKSVKKKSENISRPIK